MVMLSKSVLSIAAGAAMAHSAAASMIWTGSGTGSGPLSASAEFAVSGSSLVVTLTNTGTGDVLVPSDVLTAVLFDVSGTPLMLTRTSAVLAPGSSVLYDLDGQPA